MRDGFQGHNVYRINTKAKRGTSEKHAWDQRVIDMFSLRRMLRNLAKLVHHHAKRATASPGESWEPGELHSSSPLESVVDGGLAGGHGRYQPETRVGYSSAEVLTAEFLPCWLCGFVGPLHADVSAYLARAPELKLNLIFGQGARARLARMSLAAGLQWKKGESWLHESAILLEPIQAETRRDVCNDGCGKTLGENGASRDADVTLKEAGAPRFSRPQMLHP
ncbi:hypothetical protein B0H11DRAFT_1904324 [Mycena galericulata]|nr:hypothetical protein B0H11DRAFT_1904324 [Mycena galericulata]